MRAAARKLSAFVGRHRWAVGGAWLVVLIATLPLAAKQTENLTGGGFDVPGSESAAVEERMQERYATEAGQNSIGAVLRASEDATPAQLTAAVERLGETVNGVETLTLAPEAQDAALRDLEREGLAVVSIQASADVSKQIDAAVDLREDVAPGEASDGVTPYLVGQPAAWAGLQELSKEDLASAEATGFPIVALILITVFGSLAAAALPLALGFVSVIVTGAVIYLLSLSMDMSVFVTNMASMIGIGVAVDYSLFVLARYREEVRAGRPADEAREAALSTSGLAVAFSGMAVIISLAGIWMVDNQALRSMALGAMVVVAIAIIAAIVLLPTLISLLGHRVEAGGIAWRVTRFFRRHTFERRRRPGSSAPGGDSAFWQRWTDRVMRRPVLSVVLSAGTLLVLAIPVLSMQTGTGALSQFPDDHDVTVGVELLADASGGGADPIRVVAELDVGASNPAEASAMTALRNDITGDHAVARVADWQPSQDGQTVLLDVFPTSAGDDDATLALVERLRTETVPASELVALGATTQVGGESARILDVRDLISGSMWKIILFILGLSFVMLTLMLRSLLLPLKAVVMNLLSIGAAFGVLVVVFQWGWFDGFLGFQSTGALDTINVPLIVAVVFGLSMDYEVFLLSRIRERYEKHGDNRRAVAEGLESSAPTISSAAFIMVAVFTVFVFTGVPSIKEIGLGNAVAIALDATLVRLVLVPATMQLMGKWNWWIPAWLDRRLPHLGFEEFEEPAPRTAPAEA
ncbi:MAG: putative drug exporter of the superfamily [Solirubrobacterales bacterium]|jgi:RND superfamily putative drug exporter|nr:putative drug exporter of the superfamily [Solirubrobacterales bacterium]